MERKTMKPVLAGALALAAVLGAASAHAATRSDPAGDFLPSFIGPNNPDLDALSVTVSLDGSNFLISATEAGPIGLTNGSEFVFGVNTGGAFALFGADQPGVLFDDVIVLAPNATGFVADNLTGMTTVTGLASGTVTVSGDTISAVVPIADLPSTGLVPAAYGFSLWPRLATMADGFADIADFAPNNTTFTAVPEPANWALMIVGFGALGATLRMKRREASRATV
jgi:hypothetical protein